jgi:anti-sigma B factor antagonist
MKSSIQHGEEATTLRVEGELDALSAPTLRPAIDTILGEKPKLVVVDLSALRMIDSSGVGAIVSLYKRLRATGGDVRLDGLAGQPLAIFKVLKLDRVFQIG